MKEVNRNVSHRAISDTSKVQSSDGAAINYLPEWQKTERQSC